MDSIIEKGMANLRKIPYFPQIQAKSKYALVDITLSVISAAFEEVAKIVPEFKEEIKDWNDGRRVAMGVLPKGPFVTLEKKGDKIIYLGKGLSSPDVTFLFKNLDSAVLVFTAQMSSHQAVSECRILVDGNNSYAMELNRTLAIVETYLFPAFITNMIFKRPPKLTMSQEILRGKIYAALLPAILKQSMKKIL